MLRARPGPGVGWASPLAREAGRDRAAAESGGARTALARLEAGARQVLGQREERRPGRHHRRALIAELPVVERERKVAGVQRGAAARRAEHPPAPAPRAARSAAPCASRITSRSPRPRRAQDRRACEATAPHARRAARHCAPGARGRRAAARGCERRAGRERGEPAHRAEAAERSARRRPALAARNAAHQRHVGGRARDDRGTAEPELRPVAEPVHPAAVLGRASARRPAGAGRDRARAARRARSRPATARPAARQPGVRADDAGTTGRRPLRAARRRQRRRRSRRAGRADRHPPSRLPAPLTERGDAREHRLASGRPGGATAPTPPAAQPSASSTVTRAFRPSAGVAGSGARGRCRRPRALLVERRRRARRRSASRTRACSSSIASPTSEASACQVVATPSPRTAPSTSTKYGAPGTA